MSSQKQMLRARLFHRALRLGLAVALLAALASPAGAQIAQSWARATAHVPWSGFVRTGAVFNDEMWVGDGVSSNWFYHSKDGVNWAPSFIAYHTSDERPQLVPFKNKLWAVDDECGKVSPGHVYATSNGTNWATVVTAPWVSIVRNAPLVYNDKMWVVGVAPSLTWPYQAHRSVYCSNAAGTSWTQVLESLPEDIVGPRTSQCDGFATAVFAGKMWLWGGAVTSNYWGGGSLDRTTVCHNDAWYSTDGVKWTRASVACAWPPRQHHSVVAYNGTLWLMGGDGNGGGQFNDIWNSTDGIRWTKAGDSLPRTPGDTFQPLLYHDNLWLFNGNPQVVQYTPLLLAVAPFSGGSQATLYWSAMPGVTGYTVQRDDAADFKTPLQEASVSAATLNYTFKGLPDGKTFWYRVRGNKAGGVAGAWSPGTSSTQDATLPTGWVGVGGNGSFPPAYTARLVLDVADPGTKASGVYQMRFSTDQKNWSPWQPYAARATYFAKRSGTLPVTVQVSDRAGNRQNFTTTATIPALKAIFVDAANIQGPWQGTLEHPYLTIQSAIANRPNHVVVVVAPGDYQGPVYYNGTNIVLRSIDPEAPEIVQSTVIHGKNEPVIQLAGYEDAASQIAGFTITDGIASRPDGAPTAGGGICGNGTHAAILNNRILNNQAFYSYVETIYPPGWDPEHPAGTVYHNRYNKGFGVGIAGCQGLIQNNIIAGNAAGDLAAPVIRNEKSGAAKPVINWPITPPPVTVIETSTTLFGGAALYNCNGTIQNNTIWGNIAYPANDGSDGVIQNCAGILRNNIIALNSAHHILQGSSAPSTSDIPGWTGGGTGNIAGDPLLVNPAHADFHLQPASPCIDAGALIISQPRDLEGTPRGLGLANGLRGDGGKYDIGALEYALPDPAVWVLEPHGGETLKAGTAFRMQFTMDPRRAGSWALLELRSATGRVLQSWIVNVPASGAYLLFRTLPDTAGTGCRFRVTSVSNGALWGQSPPFTLVR